MEGNSLEHVETALQRLAQLADELLEMDVHGDVREAVDLLRAAFADRQQLEPAVAGVVRCVQALVGQDRPSHRDVDRLHSALELQVLPELRRVGFEV